MLRWKAGQEKVYSLLSCVRVPILISYCRLPSWLVHSGQGRGELLVDGMRLVVNLLACV
jgi:hypothetical protein